MDGTIAQIIALTCHGNTFLQGGEVLSFLNENSTCQYCEAVKFVEWNKDEEVINEISGTPNEWFKHLKSKKAIGIRISAAPQNKEVAEDRTNAGFVDGGYIWQMIVTYEDEKDEAWRCRWEGCDKHLPGKTWKVSYGYSKFTTAPNIWNEDIEATSKRLIAALENIKKYSEPHKSLKWYTDRFSSALNVMMKLDYKLESRKYIYHSDLYPEGSLDEKAMAILSACQMSNVFGGMGSWNDLPPHDGPYAEYKKTSDEMYLAQIEGFVVATNTSFKH